MTEIERLREELRHLRLHTMASIFKDEVPKASKSQMSYNAFLTRLVDERVEQNRQIHQCWNCQSQLPADKDTQILQLFFPAVTPCDHEKGTGQAALY